MHLYKLSIVSFTKSTIFLCIQPTVKLASLSASSCAHWLEGFCTLVHNHTQVISSSITFYTRKDTQRQTKGSHDTFVLLKYNGKVSVMIAALYNEFEDGRQLISFAIFVKFKLCHYKNYISGLKIITFLLDPAGHTRTRRGPDVARGPDVVHH